MACLFEGKLRFNAFSNNPPQFKAFSSLANHVKVARTCMRKEEENVDKKRDGNRCREKEKKTKAEVHGWMC